MAQRLFKQVGENKDTGNSQKEFIRSAWDNFLLGKSRSHTESLRKQIKQ